MQNVTYPSCGDCIYGDFRGDYGEPGPKVCMYLHIEKHLMKFY